MARARRNRGVESDIEVPSLSSYLDIGESDLDYALAYEKVDAAPHAKLEMVKSEMIADLTTKSKSKNREVGRLSEGDSRDQSLCRA